MAIASNAISELHLKNMHNYWQNKKVSVRSVVGNLIVAADLPLIIATIPYGFGAFCAVTVILLLVFFATTNVCYAQH